ncbi:hypothetical protein HDU67_003312 [Dinochytrium kinnereticum]|nr:hypothetical protein HDU67_003312 [Dinochytrium kinnereticum]
MTSAFAEGKDSTKFYDEQASTNEGEYKIPPIALKLHNTSTKFTTTGTVTNAVFNGVVGLVGVATSAAQHAQSSQWNLGATQKSLIGGASAVLAALSFSSNVSSPQSPSLSRKYQGGQD